MFNKILVALNHGETDAFILDEAKHLASCSQAQVMLLHVLTPIETSANHGINPFQNTESAEMERLRSIAQRFTDAGITTEFTQMQGNASRLICQVAEEWSADVIVLGRRGRSGVSELLLGSVSNHVLHHAPCSVLTVQGKTARTDNEELQHYLDTF